MKKLMICACLALIVLGACKERKTVPLSENIHQRDSMQRIIEQRDNEINDMLGTLNEVQEGLRQINEAENRLNVVRGGEGADKRAQITENIRVIANSMARNRELVRKLQQQLRESRFNGEELKKVIANLTQQLDEKEMQLQKLREELNAKDVQIAKLDEQVGDLNASVENLRTENESRAKVISNQDQQLNTAWYVYGTKKELKEQRIIVDGKVLQANFNKSYFTKVDIRVDKEVKLYSKSAKVLTMHPSGSYTLNRDASGQYMLRINNPQIFWSTSKYLVVQVK